jgi:hypothetical protein
MPTAIIFFLPAEIVFLVLGALCLAVAFGYLFGPTRDGTSRRWASLLGREHAAFAMRYLFSLILIECGAIFTYVAFTSN